MVNKDKEPLIGMLVASCDESGKLADSYCATFAGWLSEISALNVMSERWDNLLAANGIEYIKMSEALNFRGEFLGWKDRRIERDRILSDLAELSHNHAVCFVAAPISCEQFKRLPDQHRQKLSNPQYCGFELCINVMANNAANLGSQLQIWCDATEEVSETCIRLYRKLRSRSQLIRDTCVSITFGEDHFYPALQVADIYASCARQDSMRLVSKPDPIIDRLLEIFGKNGSFGGTMDYKPTDGLGSGVVSYKLAI